MSRFPYQMDCWVPFSKATETEDGGLDIEGILTLEAVDHDGDTPDYASAKAAIEEWFPTGNIREQHREEDAVGAATAVKYDDAAKIISLKAHISSGAPNTIQKIKDRVLKGFSVRGRGIRQTIGGVVKLIFKKVIETSVVDNPATGKFFEIVKMTKGEYDMADETMDIKNLQETIASLKTMATLAHWDEGMKTALLDIVTKLEEVLANEMKEQGEEGDATKTAGASTTEDPEKCEKCGGNLGENDKCEKCIEKAAADKKAAEDKAEEDKKKELEETAKAAQIKADEDFKKATADAAKTAATEAFTEFIKGAKAEIIKGVADTIAEFQKTVTDLQGKLTEMQAKQEDILKTVKPPGRPITKGEPDKPEELEGLPEDVVKAAQIALKTGDRTPLDNAFLKSSVTKDLFGSRKE